MSWESKLQFNPIFTIEKGHSVEGIYKGTREVEKIDSLLHTVEIDDVDYDFYGCGSLDYQMIGIDVGAKIKILYSGKKMANISIGDKKLKKEVHQYVVFTEKFEQKK